MNFPSTCCQTSVHMDILKGIWDSNTVASSPYIGVSLDNVRSGLSDSPIVFPHLSILPSPQHLPDVEDLAASPPCNLAAGGEVHAAVIGVVPPGPPPVVLPFIWAQDCVRGAGTMCHKQHPGVPVSSTVHLVPRTWSQARPSLLQTSLQAPQAGLSWLKLVSTTLLSSLDTQR